MPEPLGRPSPRWSPRRAALPVAAGGRLDPRRLREIAGLGIALPEHVVPNAPIAARLGIDVEWIVKRTGIEERRIAAARRTALRVRRRRRRTGAAAAGVERRRRSTWSIVATTSNDELMPGASPRVAAAIGADRAGAIDLNAACTGFVSALSVACAQIESGRAETRPRRRRRPDEPDHRPRRPRHLLPLRRRRRRRGHARRRRRPDRPGRARRRRRQRRPPAHPARDRRDRDAGPRDLQARGRPDVGGDAAGARRRRPRDSTTSTSSSTTRPTRGSCARSASGSASTRAGSSTASPSSATPRPPRSRWRSRRRGWPAPSPTAPAS